MTDETGAGAARVDATLHDAWWSLYDHAAHVDPEGKAPFRRLPLQDALRRLSDSDAQRLTESIRWKAVTELVRSGGGKLPEYETHGRHYQTYLQQLPSKVDPGVFAKGHEAVHDHVARIAGAESSTPAKDICNVDRVVVDGQDAVWIFSEFETDAAHDELARWVRPDDWPMWGPLLFKNMSPMGDPDPVPSPDKEVHQDYLEVVSLAGRELHTVLRCDFQDTADWVGMTYDLVKSLDDFLTVDRGFLLATKLPSGNHLVKALKIVGFKDPVCNFLATLVRPVWTDFARQGARNAEAIAPTESSQVPGTGRRGSAPGAESGRSQANPRHASTVASELTGQWVQTMGETVNQYTTHAQDVGLRLLSGNYGREDAARDGRQLCASLARDWGRAWKAGIELIDGMAAIDVPSTVAGPAVAGGTREFCTVAVPVPATRVPLVATNFSHVDSDRAQLTSSQLTLTPEEIEPLPDARDISVRIDVDTTGVEPGLYAGTLLSGSGQGQQKIAAHVYVSKAQAAG